MEVGEDPLRNIFYEVMIHIQGIDIGEPADCVPGHLIEVIIAEVKIL